MKRTTLIVSSLAVLIIAGQAYWIIKNRPAHADETTMAASKPAVAERKPLYWYDPMKPDAHFDKPGKSPFMDMELVPMYADEGADETTMAASKPAAAERKPLYWYDPMKPDAHFDKPGKSPFMDMQLVPMYADEGASAGAEEAPAGRGNNSIGIDPKMAQNLGVRTAKVGSGGMSQGIHVTGSVEIDERRIVAIESRTSGWVEQLSVRAVGDTLRRGQTIAGVYSPDLYAAQQELVLAARTNDERLIAATRQRLALQGLSATQISSVLKDGAAQRRAYIAAPQNGVVTELAVREGQQVTPGMPLMRIADLSRVWVVIEVPEADSAGLREGQMAEARVNALPGRVLKGKVDYVYPDLNAQARTVRARMSFDNADMTLKPGMYVDVSLAGGSKSEALMVPSEAVIRTGTRNVVILALGQGRYRPAVVEVGADRNGQTEILSGLDEGETVVVSGQFLIDSEASLRGALARMSDGEMTP